MSGCSDFPLQLYFDFSGYCDMAIGLGIIFGVYLPINFKSPLKASNLGEFWRCWHVTMTRFFTNYVFTPMSVKNTRISMARKYGGGVAFLFNFAWPIVVTFVAAGMWHGAGWNFLIFGLLHGMGLSVQKAWTIFKLPNVSHSIGTILTIVFFTITLVFFKSSTLMEAQNLIYAMFSFDFIDMGKSTEVFYYFWLLFGLFIALFLPSTQEFFSDYKVSVDEINYQTSNKFLIFFKWKPTIARVLILSIFTVFALTYGANESPFIYYKF